MHKFLKRILMMARATSVAGWFPARPGSGGEPTRRMEFEIGGRVVGRLGRNKNRPGTVLSIRLQSECGVCLGEYYFPPGCLPELYTVGWDATPDAPYAVQQDILPGKLASERREENRPITIPVPC